MGENLVSSFAQVKIVQFLGQNSRLKVDKLIFRVLMIKCLMLIGQQIIVVKKLIIINS